MKYIINSLYHISYNFLEVLDLNVSIQHQERIWNSNIYSFNCTIFCFACRVAMFLGRTSTKMICCCIIWLMLSRVWSMNNNLMSHTSIWINCPRIWNNCCYLMSVISWLRLAWIMICNISWINYSTWGLCWGNCLWIYFLPIFINISLWIDCLRNLLLHILLLLLDIHLCILLLTNFL